MHLNFHFCQLVHFSTVPSLTRTPCTSAQLLLHAVTPAWGALLGLPTVLKAAPYQELDGLSQTMTEPCSYAISWRSVSSFSYMFSHPALPCLSLPRLVSPYLPFPCLALPSIKLTLWGMDTMTIHSIPL